VAIDPKALEQLSRDELIARARALGATRPELLTRPELRDEIIRLTVDDEVARRRARGWFGVARDLVASVVSQGLNLPDTVELIRGVNLKTPKAGPPVATVTLAEIYAAQGHVAKALALLDEVLEREPDHEPARVARERFSPVVSKVTPVMPPEPEEDADVAPQASEPGELDVHEGAFERNTVVSAAHGFEPAVGDGQSLPATEASASFAVGNDGAAASASTAVLEAANSGAPSVSECSSELRNETDAEAPSRRPESSRTVVGVSAPGGDTVSSVAASPDASLPSSETSHASLHAATPPSEMSREPEECAPQAVETLEGTPASAWGEKTTLAECVAQELEAPIPSSRIEPSPRPTACASSTQSSDEGPGEMPRAESVAARNEGPGDAPWANSAAAPGEEPWANSAAAPGEELPPRGDVGVSPRLPSGSGALSPSELEDDIFLVARTSTAEAVISWRIGSRSRRLLGARATERSVALRILEVESSWDGPTCRESIVEVGAVEGGRRVSVSAAELRVAVGWLDSGIFRPLGLAAVFTGVDGPTMVLHWMPPYGPSEAQWRRLALVHLEGFTAPTPV
jgi:hypothetical protein